MIEKSLLYKDMTSILNSTKCFFGSYAELHKYDQNGSQNRMEDFINIAKECLGKDAEKSLLRDGVIFPNVDGGYDFNFRNAAYTGGIAYSNNGWHAVFYYDMKSWTDCYTIYHELAHVIQMNSRLFDNKAITNIFNKLYFKNDDTNALGKRKYKKQYTHFLKETHAEVFAEACMLLRAKNFMQRVDFSRRIKARIGKSFLDGLYDDRSTYPSNKFYMDIGARLRMIKEANRWYTSGEIDNFIDKDGNINFEGLAEKTKEIVLKYTYSPNKFYGILQNYGVDEKKIIKAKFLSALDPRWLDYSRRAKLREELKQHKKINKDLWNKKFYPLLEKDDESAILNTVCRLDRAYNKFMYLSREYSADVAEYRSFNPEFAVAYDRLPDSLCYMYLDKYFQDNDQENGKIIYGNYRAEVNNALFDSHADKEIVKKIVATMRNEPSVRTAIWNMYRERQKNPNAKIELKGFITSEPEVSHKKQQRLELRTFDYIKKNLFKQIDYLPEEKVNKIRKKIIYLASNNPEKLENIAVKEFYGPVYDENEREKIKFCARSIASFVHLAYYIDKKTFCNVMKKYTSSLQKFNGETAVRESFFTRRIKNNTECR